MFHHAHGRAEVVSVLIALGVAATTLTREITLRASPTHSREIEEVSTGDTLTTEDPCRSTTPSLLLVITNLAPVSTVSLDAAVDQVQQIWATAGLRLVLLTPTSEPARWPHRQVRVVIRATGAPGPSAAKAGRSLGTPLGWLGLDSEGHPAGRIEVSLEAVKASVLDASYLSTTVKAFPWHAQEYLIGRALGRVVAHEIGHWLFGRTHTHDGLMKAAMTGGELIHPVAPRLPGAWTSPGPEPLLASSSQCGTTDRS